MSITCPNCGKEIGLVPVAKKPAAGDTDYQGVQRKFAEAGLTRKPFPCRYRCGTTLKWPEPYKHGDHPINLDGTEHVCPNYVNKK